MLTWSSLDGLPVLPRGAFPGLTVARRAVEELMRCLRDTRGAAMTEYTVLVGTVALVSLGALVTLGVAMVNRLEFDRAFLLSPLP